MMKHFALVGRLWLLFIAASTLMASADAYDPLQVPSLDDVLSTDLTVHDIARQREIPIRVYSIPRSPRGAASASQPTILFSHGLGGSREGSAFLGKHWAARGFMAVFLQHPGSDTSVWKDQPVAKRMAELREAASAKNFWLRMQDVAAVLKQLEAWNAEPNHALFGRFDLQAVGMSGHSFGGYTTQAVSGQKLPLGRLGPTAVPITAAIVMSPSAPERGDANDAFGSVNIPWLLMTGTHDTAVIGQQTPESRRRVFAALPPGNKYELVLDRAEHSVFTDRHLPGEKQPRNPNHHRAILATSTAFWDAHLRASDEAKNWLQSDAARQVLDSADIWQFK